MNKNKKVLARHHARALGGFTLIELLVVIAIIGILAGIILVSLNTARARAKDAAVKADLTGIRNAMELYYSSQLPNGTYGSNNMGTGCPDSSAITGSGFHFPQGRQYIEAIKKNSGSGNTNIKCRAVNQNYAIMARLPSTSGSGIQYWCVDNAGFSGLASDIVAGSAGAPKCIPVP